MSKTVRAGTATDPGELSFSDALARLQRVVEAMETEDLPLETLLARYEEGMKLVRVCEARLAAAELRIQQLEQDEAGRLQTRPASVPTAEASGDRP